MAFERVLRTLLAGATALLLASCGGGSSVVSDFHPNRFVVFGDAMADLKLPGATGLYTVNGDGTINNWVLQLASHYGVTVGTTTAKAVAHARVSSTTDATGTTGGAASITSQIGTYLGASSFAANDLVVVSAGTSDLIYEGAKAVAGTQTEAAATTNLRQAAQDLATQIRRLVNGGAKHVLVLGPYNMGRTPWATAASQAAMLERLTAEFHDELVVAINGLADNVLFVDARLQMNTMTASTSYNAATVSCNSATTSTAPGIGIGLLQVDSSLCTTSTLVGTYNASTYLFADKVYPTPLAHRSLGDAAYTKLHNRW